MTPTEDRRKVTSRRRQMRPGGDLNRWEHENVRVTTVEVQRDSTDDGGKAECISGDALGWRRESEGAYASRRRATASRRRNEDKCISLKRVQAQGQHQQQGTKQDKAKSSTVRQARPRPGGTVSHERNSEQCITTFRLSIIDYFFGLF